jgi:hypothetical protein
MSKIFRRQALGPPFQKEERKGKRKRGEGSIPLIKFHDYSTALHCKGIRFAT